MVAADDNAGFGPSASPLDASRTNFAAYGLGWNLQEYRGRKSVGHMGGLPGYVSEVTIIPEMKLGLVVLTNHEAVGILYSITFRVLDRYMGVSDYDWVKVMAELIKKWQADAAETESKEAAVRPASSKPALPLEKYAGAYVDAWYGAIDIALQEGKLVMRFSHTPALTGDLEHWQYDTFKVRWRDRSLGADAFVTFSLNAEGGIQEARMKPVSPLTDFSYDFQDLRIVPVEKK